MGATSADVSGSVGRRFRTAAVSFMSRLGRSLMLPLAALPVAALLLRFGQPDMLGRNGAEPGGLAELELFAWTERIGTVFAAAGASLFDNLPLLFAVGVAIGCARKSDGTTALSAVVGYLVFDRVSKVMFQGSAISESVTLRRYDPEVPGGFTEILNIGLQNPTRVLGGILMGFVTAVLWQRYHRTKLPTWLSFFSGRRLVPIVTALVALVLGVLIGWLWPSLGELVKSAGEALSAAGATGVGIYGFINRLLIPLGLHHFVNSIVWFTLPECQVAGGTLGGDWNCYFGGDPNAGGFMAGFFPVMMFGLPAAALAIWQAAPRHRRATVGGIMFSAGLASFVTGITEPIEFAFVFVAPLLFLVHALLTGVSMAIVDLIGGQLGFGFSAGLIDMALNAFKSNTQNLVGILLVGVVYAAVYYAVFLFLIKRMNIMTPGRGAGGDTESGEVIVLTDGPGPYPGPGPAKT
ncbi:PTS transporter subunit EIIC [Rhizohabitans arisaemae]|uniref:PTS transporter subunit EIIC n=1 Tax=Rhizohabitans arisaemae TaxID=2720610 RepID=UPI0024B0C2D4|nr:PTS transporter subunit EIIC [Rhizohabitans arisaemae]